MTDLFGKCMNNIRKMPFFARIIDKLYCRIELAPAYRQPAALPGQCFVFVRGCVGISIELKALPIDGRLVVLPPDPGGENRSRSNK